jgi:hypothetical protein
MRIIKVGGTRRRLKKEGIDARGNPYLGGEIGFSSDARTFHTTPTSKRQGRFIFRARGPRLGLGLKLNGVTLMEGGQLILCSFFY